MARALISCVREQLVSFLLQEENEDPGSFVLRTAKQGLVVYGGLEQQVRKLKTKFDNIQAVLEDAERKQVNDAGVRLWLKRLKDVAYDVDDVLEEWNIAKHKSELEKEERDAENEPLLKKVRYSVSSSFAQFCQHLDIAKKIRDFNERLDLIAVDKDRYTFQLEKGVEEFQREKRGVEAERLTISLVNEKGVYGRDEQKRTLVEMLLRENSTLEDHESSLGIISIVGMGGIGKTTLAQLVFNDRDVQSHFENRIWVCVSDPFDESRIAKAILESLLNKRPELDELETLLRNVHECVSGKKILLVLDDVWTKQPEKWERLKLSLKSCSPGSRIFITTRNQVVANNIGTPPANNFVVHNLSREESWLLFSSIAFQRRTEKQCENLKYIGRQIVEKCKGLPLAAKVMGGLMQLKETEEQWQSILESDIWKLEEEYVEGGLFPPLLLSYYDLPSGLKRCFSYCAVFPKDKQISKDELIKLWMAQGYLQGTEGKEMEILGQEYFDELIMRSFFQDFKKDSKQCIVQCKMHDIVHDCAQYLTKTECFLVAVDGANKDLAKELFEEARHLSLIYETKSGIAPESIHNGKKLRSLLIDRCSYEKLRLEEASLSKLFDQLTHLRAVNLSYCLFEELPESIGRLMHLKYLNLSYNQRLKELPEVVCDLFNLQTLDLTGCSALEKLPSGLGKLSNLRHLGNSGMRLIKWKGIEKLICLRTMDEFVADGDTTNLGDLENLKHLQGHLTISISEKAADDCRREARRAKLDVMKGLLGLQLCFSDVVDDSDRVNDTMVLEALQPPPCLESLTIVHFGGRTAFPNWMISLTNLKTIGLSNCVKWDCLPALGKLLFLEELAINRIQSVQRVGVEFLGVIQGHGGPSSSSSSSIIAFPNLRVLLFSNMEEWEEWEYGISSSTGTWESITIMPNLEFLLIWNCPSLKSLPRHLSHNTKLKELRIFECPSLKECCRRDEGNEWPWELKEKALAISGEIIMRSQLSKMMVILLRRRINSGIRTKEIGRINLDVQAE